MSQTSFRIVIIILAVNTYNYFTGFSQRKPDKKVGVSFRIQENFLIHKMYISFRKANLH